MKHSQFFTCMLALSVTGCASLIPNSVRPEIEHLSHATQHFQTFDPNYGSELFNLVAHWDIKQHAYLEIAEGVDLDRFYRSSNSYGEILGNREEFTARVGWVFTVRK